MFAQSPAAQRLLRIFGTLIVLAAGLFALLQIWTYYQITPWTRDGRVRADIVTVTSDVAGLVTEVSVTHDVPVKRGQALFRIDRERYDLALHQAEAAIATQRAAIDVQSAAIAGRQSALDQAIREAKRNDGLGDLVARELVEQSHAKVSEQRAALAQAQAAVKQAQAALAQAEAAREAAQLNLARTLVTAPTDGIMSDVPLRVGDYVQPGKPALALIDTASIRVEGYFEETKLSQIRIGQKAEVRLMGDDRVWPGHVASIAGAIEDRERAPSANLLPNVNPTFSWVRLAQRVPVRISLDTGPNDPRLIAGRTASVSLLTEEGAKR